MKLVTTDTEFFEMESAVERATNRSTRVKVDIGALRHLLADHVVLLAAATGPVHRGGKAHPVERDPDQQSLP